MHPLENLNSLSLCGLICLSPVASLGRDESKGLRNNFSSGSTETKKVRFFPIRALNTL